MRVIHMRKNSASFEWLKGHRWDCRQSSVNLRHHPEVYLSRRTLYQVVQWPIPDMWPSYHPKIRLGQYLQVTKERSSQLWDHDVVMSYLHCSEMGSVRHAMHTHPVKIKRYALCFASSLQSFNQCVIVGCIIHHNRNDLHHEWLDV